MFVVNLAFSDLCMMISQCPMFVYNSFNGGVWLFGPFMCELYACTGSVFGLCSICTMAAISYDRYNVIVNGMNGTRMTYRNQPKHSIIIAILFDFYLNGFYSQAELLF